MLAEGGSVQTLEAAFGSARVADTSSFLLTQTGKHESCLGAVCVSALNFLPLAPRRVKTNARPKAPSLSFHLLAATVFEQYVCLAGGTEGDMCRVGGGGVWGLGRLPPHQNNHLWAVETVSPLPGFPMATAATTPTGTKQMRSDAPKAT